MNKSRNSEGETGLSSAMHTLLDPLKSSDKAMKRVEQLRKDKPEFMKRFSQGLDLKNPLLLSILSQTEVAYDKMVAVLSEAVSNLVLAEHSRQYSQESKGGYAPNEGHVAEECISPKVLSNHKKSSEKLKQEIFDRVKEVLVDALGLNDDEVTLESTLMDELGAESIDFLDIAFRLEKEFEIKIPRNELFAENLMAKAIDGFLPQEEIGRIEEFAPHLDISILRGNLEEVNPSDIFTVSAIVKYIQRRKEQLA